MLNKEIAFIKYLGISPGTRYHNFAANRGSLLFQLSRTEIAEIWYINRETFCLFVYDRVTCVPIAPSPRDERRRNFHADDCASMGSHLSRKPHLFSTTPVFHPNGPLVFAAATEIARCQVSTSVCIETTKCTVTRIYTYPSDFLIDDFSQSSIPFLFFDDTFRHVLK